MWIGIAAAAVILIAAGLVLWLVVFDDDDEIAGTTTTSADVARTTTTSAGVSTSTSTSTSASVASSTTLAVTGEPGDSPGEWVELDNSPFPGDAYAVAVSDEALLIDAETSAGYSLYAYMFDTGELVELPIDASDFFDEDIEGRLAVWWEGDYHGDTDSYTGERICAYLLPYGPKVYVTEEGRSPYYPQIGGDWITWAEATDWDENPEEYFLVRIYGVQADEYGEPLGDPAELVSAATSHVMGDTVWAYSLSGTHLAWENATLVDDWDPGLYAMDFGRFQPTLLEQAAVRPSLAGGTVVYYSDGLMARDLSTERVWEIDPLGDFATAGPTFAVYFRAVDYGGTSYEIVARGLAGAHEQVLGEQYDPPWMSPLIATSENHVAFVVDGTAHLFEWRGPMAY